MVPFRKLEGTADPVLQPHGAVRSHPSTLPQRVEHQQLLPPSGQPGVFRTGFQSLLHVHHPSFSSALATGWWLLLLLTPVTWLPREGRSLPWLVCVRWLSVQDLSSMDLQLNLFLFFVSFVDASPSLC